MAAILKTSGKLTLQTLLVKIIQRNLSRYSISFCQEPNILSRRIYSVDHIQKRSVSVKVPGGVVQECLSEENKQKIIQRLVAKKIISFSRPGEAGVLVPFCMVDDKPSVLFTLRSISLVSHRGQVSFPGGKRDEEDKSVVDTAIRETEEELGISKNVIDVWTTAQPMPERSGKIVVTPVVAFLGDIEVEKIPFNQNEVSEVFHLTIEHILANRRYTKFTNGVIMPVFINGPHNVWGMTATMLDYLLEFIFPSYYTKVARFPQEIVSRALKNK